jgi:cytoskeletal protein RodZ
MAPDQPVFQTPGAMIRSTREAKGLSLDDLAAETRIPDRLLAALEIDDFDQLSGTLYVRSFLRSCAQSLGLDPAVLLDSYERMLTEQEPEIPADQTWEEETKVQRIGAVPWARLGIVAVSLILVVLLVWAGRSFFGGADTSAPDATTTEQVPEGGDEAAAASESQSVAAADTLSPVIPDTVANDIVAESLPAATETDGPVVTPDPDELAAVVSLPPGDPTLVFAGDETWPLVLRVVLDRRFDFGVGSDGDREARDVTWPERTIHGVPAEGVTPGRIYTVGGRHVAYWGAADHFLLKLSSIEGVTVSLNGHPLDIPTRIVGHEWVLDRSRLAP